MSFMYINLTMCKRAAGTHSLMHLCTCISKYVFNIDDCHYFRLFCRKPPFIETCFNIITPSNLGFQIVRNNIKSNYLVLERFTIFSAFSALFISRKEKNRNTSDIRKRKKLWKHKSDSIQFQSERKLIALDWIWFPHFFWSPLRYRYRTHTKVRAGKNP